MYTTVQARPLKEILRENGIKYGDIFALSYKSNGEYVGFYDRNKKYANSSNKEYDGNYFSFLPGDEMWILKKDNNGYIMIDEKEEQYIKAADPHFLQRVITLMMTNQVKVHTIYRNPKRGRLFRLMESLFGSKHHLGERI